MEDLNLTKTQMFIYMVVVIFSFWGFLNTFSDGGILNYRYFSNHSVLIVLAVVLAYATPLRSQWMFPFLSFIALINIVLTAIVFHILLEVETLTFAIHNTHTLLPIFYIAFYFIVLKQSPEPKYFWTAALYPALYLFSFIIIGAITDFYPYPFMDVSLRGIIPVLVTTLVLMLPMLLMLSLIVLVSKNKLDQTK